MFTGIVEEVGAIADVRPLAAGREILVAATLVTQDLRPGDSIALDGACHTAVEVTPEGFAVQSVATTLSRTTLGEFLPGRKVNLERALALGTRLGGHLVQGHVDGTGTVLRLERVGEHVLIDVALPPPVEEITILQGSITLNGVSLTVNALPRKGVCQVSIIPHTWEVTALPDLRVGAKVNLEGDLIGKYVRQLLRGSAWGAAQEFPSHLDGSGGY